MASRQTGVQRRLKLVLCRFLSPTARYYNLVSFLVLGLALSPAALPYIFLFFVVLCLAVYPVVRHVLFALVLSPSPSH